jgi:hypothetical protein
MSKQRITVEDKIELLERYDDKPINVRDIAIIRAILKDYRTAQSRQLKELQNTDNKLYNKCMGVFREFLRSRGSDLHMHGRKAKDNSKAMRGIIDFIRNIQRNGGRPFDDQAVFEGWVFILRHWDRLNDFHRNRLQLTDIYAKIDEILPMIKNGKDKKTRANDALERRQAELDFQRQHRHSSGG